MGKNQNLNMTQFLGRQTFTVSNDSVHSIRTVDEIKTDNRSQTQLLMVL